MKEEVKSDVKIGDIYTIPEFGGRLIRIEDIFCGDTPRKKTKSTHSWGDVDFYHDGCNLKYKVSDDKGKTWYWEERNRQIMSLEKNWINHIIDRGYWVLVMKDDVDFFNLNESDEFEWAQDTIRNTPDLNLGQKVIVRNRGAYYPTNTDAMLELGVPGIKEFRENYGLYWWNSATDLDSHEEFLRSKVPSLGVPENGDVCYIVGQPLECNRDSEYWKYLLFRESDGKLFVMDGHGFKFVFKNLTESEEEFGWVEKEEDFLPTDKPIAIWMEDLTPQEVDRVMSFLRDCSIK